MKVTIRPLKEDDLPAADVVFRLAFGTLAGLPNPRDFGGDTEYVRTRWLTDPSAAFVADADGKPVGSVFAANWGSVAIFGPLTVHPNVWDKAIGTRLLEPMMARIDQWGPSHVGLHTVVHSAKHIRLYRKFGFWPGCMVEIMTKPVQETKPDPQMRLFSELSEDRQAEVVEECRRLTESLYVGLDLRREIRAAHAQHLGDTALFYDGSTLCGFAVCHWGPSTEAGGNKCYVKFGAVRKGAACAEQFAHLLRTCEVLAASRGASQIIAGVNTARNEACRVMISHGFRTEVVGVAMHRPYKPAYNRNDVFVIDDWR
jgi:GNAT superfamily N-acetyltransferase